MLTSERLASSDRSATYYRTLLLEMETGSNNSADTAHKIKRYNWVIRFYPELWRNGYGSSPRVLVAVPTNT